jgi:hypothetical protein
MFPTIAQYNQTIQAKGGNAFKSLSNLTFIPSRTVPVRIYSYGSGSYAVVFKAKNHYNEFAIRCFISAEQENINRYRKIDSYLENLQASWITKIQLLEEEIEVGNKLYPVIKMDWVEGQLLNVYIGEILSNNQLISELQEEFVRVSRSLEANQIGHGDIQCGNIIIQKNIAGKPTIRLIDYDGMYIPSFYNKPNLERGRAELQHPNRSQIQYDERVDRFSFWVVLCALEALKFDKSLWLQVMQGGFNTLDNLLFTGDDFKYFNNSKLVNRLYLLNKSSLSFYLNKLNNFCNSIPSTVEQPVIFNLNKQQPENIFPQDFQTNSYNHEIEIITNPGGATVLTSTFQRIGITPLKIDKAKYLDKTLTIAYGTQFKQVVVHEHQTVIDVGFSEITGTATNLNFNQNQTQHVNNITSNADINTVTNFKNQDKTGVIVVLIVLAIIILVAVVSVNSSKNNSLSAATSTTDTLSYIATDTTSMSPIDTSFASLSDTSTVAPNSFDTSTVSTDTTTTSMASSGSDLSSSYKDDNGLTARDAVNFFLLALNKSDCEAAWYITYNPTWENKGKDWFCSSEAFGGVRKVLMLDDINSISESHDEAEIWVHYYTEDTYNGNNCFKQRLYLKKVTFSSANVTKWMITRMIDLETPSQCQVTER